MTVVGLDSQEPHVLVLDPSRHVVCLIPDPSCSIFAITCTPSRAPVQTALESAVRAEAERLAGVRAEPPSGGVRALRPPSGGVRRCAALRAGGCGESLDEVSAAAAAIANGRRIVDVRFLENALGDGDGVCGQLDTLAQWRP
jgi:hypothetical protein